MRIIDWSSDVCSSDLYLDPLGVEFGLRAIRQSQGYMIAAEVAGINPDEALDNVIKHKILPKIAFDTARPAGSGRSRRELLDEFRRSEEHTSELQSLMRISYAVFFLKKKKTNTQLIPASPKLDSKN